jgi:hypothetical protein
MLETENRETENTERLLRQNLTTGSLPTLSPAFEQRLAARLGRKHLSPKTRTLLLWYTLLGIALSVGAMYGMGMDARVACASTLVPAIILLAVLLPVFGKGRRLRGHQGR